MLQATVPTMGLKNYKNRDFGNTKTDLFVEKENPFCEEGIVKTENGDCLSNTKKGLI